jgi:NAD-dependent SIR2 family protein deacetylase
MRSFIAMGSSLVVYPAAALPVIAAATRRNS